MCYQSCCQKSILFSVAARHFLLQQNSVKKKITMSFDTKIIFHVLLSIRRNSLGLSSRLLHIAIRIA